MAVLNANHIAELECMGVELALITMYDLYPQSIIVVFDKGADKGYLGAKVIADIADHCFIREESVCGEPFRLSENFP